MKKKLLKFLNELLSNPIAQALFYLALLLVVLHLYGAFSQSEDALSRIWELVKSEITLSVAFAGLVSLMMNKVLNYFKYTLEESNKITDHHHDLILQYSGHAVPEKELENKPETGRNLCDSKGVFMHLFQKHVNRNKVTKLSGAQKKSSKREKIEEAKNRYNEKGILRLPSINVFTNVCGNTSLSFEDTDEVFRLPDVIMDNAFALLDAHKNSASKNNDTIRLNDFHYEEGENKNILHFHTGRSLYYHMLMTNRCMDYEFREGFTLRDIYEYRDTVSPLAKSKFGNQIGINGLVLTNDGYVLVEKRDHSKTTWKDKFAQSISLAMKKSEIAFPKSETGQAVMTPGPEFAEENMKRILTKTLQSNFGLYENDLETITMENNFLGLARDLLEGGKPNIYFYVVANFGAKELAERIKKFVKRDLKTEDDKRGLISEDKLKSDYYLIPYEDLKVDYNYSMKIDRSKCIRIRRHVSPRAGFFKDLKERMKHGLARTLGRHYEKECGEALLVTLAFLELCEGRIKVLNGKTNSK